MTDAKVTIERELELIDGMIDVQLHHAEQCDRIANRTMAEKQKGWDMERVALLRKLRAALVPAADLIPQDKLFVCGQMGAHVTRVRVEQPAAVPPGWKLVPIKPTPGMIASGAVALVKASHSDIDPTMEEVTAAYRAMTAAGDKP